MQTRGNSVWGLWGRLNIQTGRPCPHSTTPSAFFFFFPFLKSFILPVIVAQKKRTLLPAARGAAAWFGSCNTLNPCFQSERKEEETETKAGDHDGGTVKSVLTDHSCWAIANAKQTHSRRIPISQSLHFRPSRPRTNKN